MDDTVGVILAGGLARRMGGGDKALQVVGGRTVLDRLVRCMAPQVSALVLNANGDPARFAAYGLPVVPDSLPGHPGPLAGVLAGMDWAAAHAPGARWVATAPGDAPFLPTDFVRRLHKERGGAMFACAASGGQAHPVAALWPVSVRAELLAAVTAGQRKIDAFTRKERTALVEWPLEGVDPFFNVNTPDDLRLAGNAAVPD